jgi:hypothetical protein
MNRPKSPNKCHQSDLCKLSPFVQKTHKSRHLTQAVVAGVRQSKRNQIMRIKKSILLASTVAIVACSGGTSNTENTQVCRSYASSSMTDGGVTETCEFNRDSFVLNCSSDSGSAFYKVYPSIEEFVLESKTLGLFKTTMGVYDDLIVENYLYEANQLKAINIEFSDLISPDSYMTITHDEFDRFNRPISGILTSNLGLECNGNTVSLSYSESEKKVSIVTTGSCPFFAGNESIFDNDSNLISRTAFGITTDYTILATDEVCF